MSWLSAHLLSVVLFLPLAGAVIVALLPRGEGNQHKGVAIITSLVTFFVSLLLWTGFDSTKGGFQFEERVEWAPSLGISYHLGIDGVALLLILLTTFLGPIVLLSTWKDVQKRVKEFCLALLVLETAMIGTLGALDLVLFYVFWEAMLIPMYLLVGVWGSDRRIYAAVTAAGRKARGARAVDHLIAAAACSANLPLFTRNPDDFRALDGIVQVVSV